MQTDGLTKFAIAIGLCTLALFLLAIFGCEAVKRVDQAIWQSPLGPKGAPGPDPPPIVELFAGGLALAGYGGMAEWIRRNKKNGMQQIRDNAERLARIEDELTFFRGQLEKSK